MQSLVSGTRKLIHFRQIHLKRESESTRYWQSLPVRITVLAFVVFLGKRGLPVFDFRGKLPYNL